MGSLYDPPRTPVQAIGYSALAQDFDWLPTILAADAKLTRPLPVPLPRHASRPRLLPSFSLNRYADELAAGNRCRNFPRLGVQS